MILSHNELLTLIESGVINAKPEQVNQSSIDVTLFNVVRFESVLNYTIETRPIVDLSSCKPKLELLEVDLDVKRDFILPPGGFMLASTVEIFNLPRNISAYFVMKSSLARLGLDHLAARWCDAGWNNSQLTLELKNSTRFHELTGFKTGMRIGHVVFHRHKSVPEFASYATKGRYNNQQGPIDSKGVPQSYKE